MRRTVNSHKIFILFCFLQGVFSVQAYAMDIDISKTGAVGDGKTLNTIVIQKAIDECSKNGGGKVTFPAGTWLSGTLLLKTGVILYLDEKAILSGSTNIEDYQLVDEFKDGRGASMGYCFIGAKNAAHIGISGKGKINGNGKALLEKNGRSKRPFLIRLVGCSGVFVSDVSMEGPAAWTMHLFESKNVRVERVVIKSRGLSNNDGIDIDCCENVQVKDCDIDSGDDAVCLKTTGTRPCRNIEISGCKINTGQGAFKIGTESIGNFEHISFHDCMVQSTKGIKIYSVDGAYLKNLKIANITIEKATLPVMIRLGARLKVFRRGDEKRTVGGIENIDIKNIKVKNATQMALLISGIPGGLVKNVTISAFDVHLAGGGMAEDTETVLPENIADYPELTMFGKVMPGHGMYIRHAENINLRDINLSVEQQDGRPVIVTTDLSNSGFSDLRMVANNSAQPLIQLKDSRNIILHRLNILNKQLNVLKAEGIGSKGIVIDKKYGNIQFGEGALRDAIQLPD